jgi:hypothetical protein
MNYDYCAGFHPDLADCHVGLAREGFCSSAVVAVAEHSHFFTLVTKMGTIDVFEFPAAHKSVATIP